MAGKDGAGRGSGGDAVRMEGIDYDVTKAVLESISVTTEAILLSEFDKFMKSNEFMLASKNKFMSYISALAILSLALKDESKENVSRIMGAIGLDFDEKVFELIPKTYMNNRIVYVYAFYFLVINGQETSEAKIRDVVEALGIAFDKATFEETLGSICSNTKCGRILP
jgi:ribosomal protein L12E/L44/L45/RPP1/RPP2